MTSTQIAENENIRSIKSALPRYIGGKRLTHTLSVETECEALASVFGGSDAFTLKLCAAALCHDITKEKKLKEQLELCARFGIAVGPYDTLSPKVFHARTGAALARVDFPAVIDDEAAGFIYYHTTGRENMNLGEKLLYLADYIEPTREYDDCKALRAMFYDGLAENASSQDKLYTHLDRVLVASFDLTLKDLIKSGAVIADDTIKSRNYLLRELASGTAHPAAV